MGEGSSFQKRKRGHTEFKICGAGLMGGSLADHTRRVHGKGEGVQYQEPESEGEEGQMDYMVSFPKIPLIRACLVQGCPRRVQSATLMRDNFGRLHWESQVTILEEGSEPHLL